MEGKKEATAFDPVAAGTVDQDKIKKQKAEALQRFKEKKAKKEAERISNAKKLKELLIKEKAWDKIGADLQTWVESLAVAKPANGGSQTSLLTTLFGPTPKVGDKVTLADAFNKTYKGKATLDIYVKRWKEKGVIVEFTANTADMLKSTYEIKAINA